MDLSCCCQALSADPMSGGCDSVAPLRRLLLPERQQALHVRRVVVVLLASGGGGVGGCAVLLQLLRRRRRLWRRLGLLLVLVLALPEGLGVAAVAGVLLLRLRGCRAHLHDKI